jgi:hypothetical protein
MRNIRTPTIAVLIVLGSIGCRAKMQEATEAVVAVFDRSPEWRFSETKATLANCEKELLPDFEVERVRKGEFYTPINIRRKSDGKIVYSPKRGHDEVVFARRSNVLYVAEHGPISSGCSVVAVDLDSGAILWNTHLEGIGPIDHSKYRNRVNIELDGQGVVVFGNESSGCYVEVLNVRTGEQVAHKKLPSE